MDWKDTVIKTEEHSESIWCPHCSGEFGIETYIETTREEQAEISFKAGVKEVVDWIEKNSEEYQDSDPGCHYYVIFKQIEISIWQDKLKEWGIDG